MNAEFFLNKVLDKALEFALQFHILGLGYDSFNVVKPGGILAFTNPGRFNVQVDADNKVVRYWAG